MGPVWQRDSDGWHWKEKTVVADLPSHKLTDKMQSHADVTRMYTRHKTSTAKNRTVWFSLGVCVCVCVEAANRNSTQLETEEMLVYFSKYENKKTYKS